MKRYETFQSNGVCVACAGDCCKRLPGPYHPSDFPKPITKAYLSELLASGKVVAESRGKYYLRPSCSGDNGGSFPDYSRGACVFLTELGCSLPSEARPLGCRALKPKDKLGDSCTCTSYALDDAFEVWSSYVTLILELKEELRQLSG